MTVTLSIVITVVVRLGEWARREGVAYITAWRCWNEGKLPVPARKAGRLILVDAPEPGQGRTVVCARVCSADQKPDLDGQIARVVAWCRNQSVPVDQGPAPLHLHHWGAPR